MFQLPSNRFIIPGNYQCIIEAKNFYNKTINSTLSSDIPMPGMYILYRSSSLQMFFEKGALKNFTEKFHRKAPVLESLFNKVRLKRDSNTGFLLRNLQNF